MFSPSVDSIRKEETQNYIKNFRVTEIKITVIKQGEIYFLFLGWRETIISLSGVGMNSKIRSQMFTIKMSQLIRQLPNSL